MTNSSSQRLQLLPTLARTSPVLFSLVLLLYSMLAPSFNSFYLLSLVLLSSISNRFFKNAIMKPLYKLSGGNYIFLLGSGSRPAGAMSCQFTLDNKKATSFGMPSGHSQMAWTIGTYLICQIVKRLTINLDKEKNTNLSAILVLDNIWIFVSIILLLSAMIFISYSRVYIEGCHTIQQVIAGGIVGALTGFLAFYFEDDIKRGILGNS